MGKKKYSWIRTNSLGCVDYTGRNRHWSLALDGEDMSDCINSANLVAPRRCKTKREAAIYLQDKLIEAMDPVFEKISATIYGSDGGE